MSKDKEQVMVFPTSLLMSKYPFQGVESGLQMARIADLVLYKNQSLSFMKRSEAETNPSFKQLIPYCILRNKDNKIFAYKRTKKGGENRLHDFYSIGIGGHVNPIDGDILAGEESYKKALTREILEEVGLTPDQYLDRIISVINDDSNDVGKVHFGIVHFVNVKPTAVLSFKDEAVATGDFLSIEQIKELNLENWSRLLVENAKL